MQYIDLIVELPVVMQCQIPTIRTVQRTVEMPQVEFLDPAVDVPVVVQRQAPQERIRERIVEEIGVPVPRVMEETIEVETLKSQRFEGESSLLADNKLASKPDGRCAVQAPEWEELQKLRVEGLVAIHDINKLPNDKDSLELFKETLSSSSLMQVQSGVFVSTGAE